MVEQAQYRNRWIAMQHKASHSRLTITQQSISDKTFLPNEAVLPSVVQEWTTANQPRQESSQFGNSFRLLGQQLRGCEHLFGMCEVVNQLDFLHKISSNVPHLLTQIVLCKGAVCRKPETDIFIARGIPVHQHALH